MSDPQGQAAGRGGPSWLQGTAAARTASPAAVAPELPTHFVGATPGTSDDLFSARYNRNGITPIPYMIVALAAMAAAVWAYGWSEPTAEATDPVRSSEWWTNITAVLLPGEELRVGSFSELRMWVCLGLLVLAAVLVIVWMARIGSNIRSGHAPFGATLPFLAFPAWWMLPLTIAIGADGTRSRSDLLMRSLVAFGLLFAQFLLLRWPVLNRIWRAGHLRYDLASIGLWFPMMIPWLMFLGSTVVTFIVVGDKEPISDSPWIPTEAMLDWARWTTRATSAGILVLLVVVTIAQHIGMARDRREDDAARLGPGAVQQPV